jgi:hypothetical protein
MACQTNQFFIICYFFYEISGLGGLNDVVLYTRRYDTSIVSNFLCNASVVLVQPVVVVVVILVSVAIRCNSVYCCM